MLEDYSLKLRPYIFHGVEVEHKGEEAIATCPFCQKRKLYISTETGQFNCKTSGCESGNIWTFLQSLYKESTESTSDKWYQKISEERGVSVEYLKLWGIVQSSLSGELMVPAFNIYGKLTNLYLWLTVTEKPKLAKKKSKVSVAVKPKTKRVLLGTPTIKPGIFGVHQWSPKLNKVIIVEGPWTGSAASQILFSCRSSEGELGNGAIIKPTADKEASLGKDYNLVGIPGCNNFRDAWVKLFADKEVTILFDNDHPGQHKLCAGWEGTLRTASILLGSETPPKSIKALKWGPSGYSPEVPSGYDLRDSLTNKLTPQESVYKIASRTLQYISPKLVNISENEVKKKIKKGKVGRTPVPVHCESFQDVREAWRRAFKWTRDLDVSLSTLLAVAASTSFPATPGTAQLWLRLIGPPGSGKSSLCEALSVSKKYCFPLSQQTGFHSGSRNAEGESCSLIPSMNLKTVIIKDGDTLMNSSNVNQSLAELRDIYDGTTRARYRNTTEAQNYTGLCITFIIGGTRSLKRLNRSFLGDRFLDCVIYERGSDPLLEEGILKRATANALNGMRLFTESNDKPQDEKMITAMELTAGYLHYLRENIESLSNEIEFTPARLRECEMLGKVVSYMRARKDKELEDEEDEVELPTRLAQQFVRLANCQAIVLNRQEVDQDVMERVKKVARDTSQGITYLIASTIANKGMPLEARTIANLIDRTPQRVNAVCRFMSSIGIINRRTKRGKSNLWRLDRDIYKIMKYLNSKPQSE